MLYKFSIEKMDEISSIFGAVFGLILIILYKISPTIQLITIGLSLFSSCFIYLLIKRKKSYNDIQSNSNSLKLLFESLFFIFFSIGLYTIHVFESRPAVYFILVSLCSGVLAISIYLNTSKLGTTIQIIKIFVLSLYIKYSIYFYGSGFPRIDSWTHAKMNDALSQVGDISVLFEKEFSFPIMHVWTAIVKIITGTNIKEASNFAIIVPLVISTIFVFLVAKNFISENSSLIAMLIINVTDFHTYWGSTPQTTSFGAILYFILLFVLLKNLLNRNPRLAIISLIIILTLILTHAVSSFIFLITLFGLVMGSLIYKIVFNHEETVFLNNIALVTGSSLILYWFSAIYTKGEGSFFDKVTSSLVYYVTGYASLLNRPEAKISYSEYLSPFIERLADSMGLSILLLFSITGCLFWLSSNYRNKFNFSSIICITLLLGITFGFPFFGLRNIIPHRWFIFEYFFLSIMSAYSISKISILFYRPISKKIFIFMTLFMLTFFMTSSTISNLDSPLWLKNETVSTTYTFQEIKGAETFSKYSSNLVGDRRYGNSVLGYYCNVDNSYLENVDEILSSKNKIFMWRKYMLSRPIQNIEYFPDYYKSIDIPKILGYSYFLKLEQCDKLYSNGELSAYYIT